MKIRHWDTIIPIIADNSVRIMAEVGVFKSRFCTAILRDLLCNRVLDEYWAVDSWESFSSESDRFYESIGKDKWDALYGHCCSLMLPHKQLRVLRMESVKAASMFPNRYFDMVFIDANHDYEAVKIDILTWMPKIRSGGIISGHDYLKGRSDLQGVTKAVNEIFGFDGIRAGLGAVWYRRV